MGASLPQIKVDDQSVMLMQSRWKSQLDPILRNPLLDGVLIKGIQINNGFTIINHGLGRTQLGWFIVDQVGPNNINRPPTSAFSDTTLTLVSSVSVTIALWCF